MRNFEQILEQHADGTGKLSVSVETWMDPELAIAPTFCHIKASPDSLHALGELLIAFAKEDQGETFFIHPTGPGKNHFSPESNCGIYLTKTDNTSEDS